MGRELPILFNTDMVLAILDGRKKATRRNAPSLHNICMRNQQPPLVCEKCFTHYI